MVAAIEAGNADGSIFFTTEENIVAYGCPNTAGYVVPSTYATEKILSVLLAAKLAKNKVYFDIRCPQGSVYPLVIRVGIK